MKPGTPGQHDIDVTDIEYLRHGDRPLLARLYRPRNKPARPGAFPLVIDIHGGAWCLKDRFADAAVDETLARSGMVVAALDFRMPPQAGYPASLADINYATRWFKSRAAQFDSRADRVCLLGFSSGAHQAMLSAMRPHDPRYAALPLASGEAVDASVRCLALCSPLVDPLERYRYVHRLKAEGDATLADRVGPHHDRYWGSEAAMAEGNPVLALERGEPVHTSPVLYVSLTRDRMHPRISLDRFVKGYRDAGGRLELEWFEEASGDSFITGNPKTPDAIAALNKVIAFVQREAGAD